MQGMSIDFSSFLPFAFCLLTVIASNDGKWASAFLSFPFGLFLFPLRPGSSSCNNQYLVVKRDGPEENG